MECRTFLYYLCLLGVPASPVPALGAFLHQWLGEPPKVAPRVCVSTTFSGAVADEKLEALWPTMHGRNLGGLSSHAAPRNLSSSLAWQWHHPQGRFYTVVNGIVMDGGGNIFVAEDDAVHKLSPDGAVLWRYCHRRGVVASAPVLEGGAVYFDNSAGFVFAVDAATGKELWTKQIGTSIGCDTHAVAAHGDILIAGSQTVPTEAGGTAGGRYLHCLQRSDGSRLWDFTPDAGVWNFYGIFPGDGTVLFQDMEGRAYRLSLNDGKVLWKRGGMTGTWNDGSLALGPDGIVYAVTTLGPNDGRTPGSIDAYRINDGELLWSAKVPHPPNQFPAVGPLGKGMKPSVVVAVGTYSPTAIFTFDAETGAQQWRWQGPPAGPFGAAGDEEGFPLRSALHIPRPKCWPNAWSNPSIDAAGVVYIGHNSGYFLAIQDTNGDGHISEAEVSHFNGGAGFPGAGPAIGPGVVAIASCDSVFVFKA